MCVDEHRCQACPIDYLNKGIGANAISPRSPGFEDSAKPSALERYRDDVIAHEPDLLLLCYGLNDMRAGMPLGDFIEDMRTIITHVRAACNPVILLTTIYYMTGWKSFPPFDRGSMELTETYNAAIASLAQELGCLWPICGRPRVALIGSSTRMACTRTGWGIW